MLVLINEARKLRWCKKLKPEKNRIFCRQEILSSSRRFWGVIFRLHNTIIMQYSNHVPFYYHEMSHGFSRHIFNSNAYYRKQQCLCYDKETVRQIIQNQDETFRRQVQELHRLYARQRELMDDVKIRTQSSKSIFPGLSQAARHDDARQFLGFDSVSNIFDLNEEKTSLTCITGQAEEGRLSEKKSNLFIDLNVAFVPESLTSSSAENFCLMEATRHEHCMGYGAIDLNTVPCDLPPESEVGRENNFPSEDSVENKNIDRMDMNNVDVDKETEHVQEPDKVATAAETLAEIFSSALNGGKSTGAIADEGLETSNGSLLWFADIISSLGDDWCHQLVPLERTEDKNRAEPSSKMVQRKSLNLSRAVRRGTQNVSTTFSAREVSCLKCLETDDRANVRKQKLTVQRNVRKTERSTVKKQLRTRKEQSVLRDWSKMKKRRSLRRRKYTC